MYGGERLLFRGLGRGVGLAVGYHERGSGSNASLSAVCCGAMMISDWDLGNQSCALPLLPACLSVFVPGSQPGGVEAAAAAGDSEDEAPSDADMQQADVDTAASGSAGRVGTDSDPDDTPHQQQQQQVPFELTDMDVEVRLLPGASSSSDGGVFKVCGFIGSPRGFGVALRAREDAGQVDMCT